MHAQNIIPWLIHYQYWLIFPVAIVEGPVIMIIAGFLASLGIINFTVALGVVTVGDLIGDSFYYMIGRYGKETFIRKYGKYVGITLEREQKIETYFSKHANRTLIIAKFAHGFGSLVLVAAGLAKVTYQKILSFNIPTTLLKALLLMLVGYYFGKVSFRLNIVLDYLSFGALLIIVILYFTLLRRRVTDMVEHDPEASANETNVNA